ncbi:MAG: DNRLRE domain-containing protein [Gemmatimonadetes bacterium]|nr:DNRLRE domain-containing protein [Gemmatimonadota bacterium]
MVRSFRRSSFEVTAARLAGVAILGALAAASGVNGCSDLGSAPQVEPPPPPPMETVTVEATRDATLYEEVSGGLASGAGLRLFAGATLTDAIRRSVLHFDLSGIDVPGALVRAELTLTATPTGNASPAVRTLTLHRVTESWSEGTSVPPEPGGFGTPAGVGDVTWLHRDFDTVLWSTPGGSFDPAASGSAMVGGAGVYKWTGTGLAVDVQAWLDDPSGNHGWLLRGEEAVSQSAKRFGSRESGTKPVLTLVFQPPVPR